MKKNQPWSNISAAHRLFIIDFCAEDFENPARGSKDIERTQWCDGQTDRQMDGQMDGRTDRKTTKLKAICLPIHGGGRHNKLMFWLH